jgi:hypothetical protein
MEYGRQELDQEVDDWALLNSSMIFQNSNSK